MKHRMYEIKREGKGWRVYEVFDPSKGKIKTTINETSLWKVRDALVKMNEGMKLVSNRNEGMGWRMLFEEVE